MYFWYIFFAYLISFVLLFLLLVQSYIKLKKLKEDGLLDENEFEKAKKKLLD